MHIKRFEAASMAEALAQVREELGPDALILSSRTIRPSQGRFGFMARERVEVQAALERGRAEASTPAAGLSDPVSLAPQAARPGQGTEGEALAKVVGELRRELARLRGRESFEEEVRSELRGLRSALSGALGQRVRDDVDPSIERLTRRGLDWVHAESLLGECRERSGHDSEPALRALLRERIEARMTPPRAAAAGQIRVLVGAAGVGKTTSLAKLAARNEEGEREVALVSLDHFRIGATDQLRRYADFLDAPFCELADAASLPSVLERYRGHSVLVDTAGRDARMEPGASSLAALEAAGPLRERLGARCSIDLVVDASARREVQRAHVKRFAALAPDRLILAKADECDSLVDVANLLLDEDCPPVCWMGTGQRVPEDLVEADAAVLLRDVFGQAA